MSPTEFMYLGLVIFALLTFAGVLAGVSWMERSWARKNGK